jgi:phage terminase large subunit-like protein
MGNVIRPPWKKGTVRPDYAAGVWSYACGAPAETHPQYAEAVRIFERKKINPWWIRSRVDVVAVLEGCTFDPGRALKAAGWLESNLIHTMGEWSGKPFDLFDWQAYDVVLPLFGWLRADGTRRFRKAAVWIPKKNGKSGLASGFGLYLTCGDGEDSAHVYCAASAKHQADTVHRQARDFVKRSPGLRETMRVFDSTYRIVHPSSNSFFAAVSSDAGTQEGLNWHGLIVDELHVIDRRLFGSLEQGGMARRNPLLLNISTAGVYDESSIGHAIWSHSKAVLSGMVEDTSFFARIYAADPEHDDPGDPAVWQKANPSMGITFDESVLREKWQQVQTSPSMLADFLRYHLNVWVQAAARWIDPADWLSCGEVSNASVFAGGELALSPFAEQLRGRPCYGGMDLSSVRDMTANALLFPPHGDDPYYRALCWYWLPGENLTDLGLKARAPYPSWSAAGWLNLTPGNIIDDQHIRAFWNKAVDVFDVREIAFDRYMSTSVVTQMLEQDGLPLVEFGQGYASMSPAVKEMEKIIIGGQLKHDGNPIMAWNVANAQIARDPADNIKLVRGNKGKATRYHIDGIIALCMAMGRAARQGGKSGKSRYESETENVRVVTYG